ncbi:MAG TPA: protein phosphatase 2C domain-containing protein [Longimicrobium sp.]
MTDATLVPTAAPAAPSAGRTAGDWRVLGVSVRGTGHARGGLPCQDAHDWRRLPRGAVALAAADGAGSAPLAEAGARAAAHAAVDALARAAAAVDASGDGWTAALDAALAAALEAVHAEAARRGADIRDLATTLIACVAWDGGVAAAQVGDGAVIVATEDGGMRSVTVPTSGEFANETVFLTSPGAVAAAQRAAWRGEARHVGVFTDGLQGLALKFPEKVPHAPFFAPLFAFAAEGGDPREAERQLGAFLSGPRVTARSDDDLTLLLAARGHG